MGRRSLLNRPPRTPSREAPPPVPLKSMPPVCWDYDTPKPAVAKSSLPPMPAPAVAPIVREAPAASLPAFVAAAIGGAILALGVAALVTAAWALRPELAAGALGS